MTTEFWVNAEIFYERWLMSLFFLVVLLIIMSIFTYTYTAKGERKKPLIRIMVIAIILTSIGGFGHIRYQDYIPSAMHVNPLIRDRIPTFLGYQYYGTSQEMYYTDLNDIDALREMALYKEVPIHEPLTYFGRGDYSYYFQCANGDFFRHAQNIRYDETIDEPKLVGSRFELKDDAFKEIGFKNPTNTMFFEIVLPAAMEDKEYKPADERQFLRIQTVIDDWNF